MKKYRFLSLLLLIPMVLSLVLPAAALEEPEVYCDHAVDVYKRQYQHHQVMANK